MKMFIVVVATIILMIIGSAETYQLGSHEINFNLSVPVNWALHVNLFLHVKSRSCTEGDRYGQ